MKSTLKMREGRFTVDPLAGHLLEVSSSNSDEQTWGVNVRKVKPSTNQISDEQTWGVNDRVVKPETSTVTP